MNTEIRYGQCAQCGGSLTANHKCPRRIEQSEPMKTSRLRHVIRIYAATASLENKDLAKAWQCSESTVSRFLSGKQWPDGPTVARIVSWLMTT